MSMVKSFERRTHCREKFHNDRSRAVTRSTAGPSFKPVSFDDKATVNFFALKADRTAQKPACARSRRRSTPRLKDFKPVPGSVDFDLHRGEADRVDIGVILICGRRHSKRGTKA